MSKIRAYSQSQNHQAQAQSHNSYQNRRSANRQKNTPRHGYQFNLNMQGHQAQHRVISTNDVEKVNKITLIHKITIIPLKIVSVEEVNSKKLALLHLVSNIRKLAPLPAEYTQLSKVYRSSEELFAPLCRFIYEDLFEYTELNLVETEEYQWLHKFTSLVDSAKSGTEYHLYKKYIQSPIVKDTNSLLPLLGDKVNTLNMQVHTVNLNIKAISALNPGQTSVDVSDCPVCALTKEAQFQFFEHLSNYFAMFWGLHIEYCLLVTHGQFTEESG